MTDDYKNDFENFLSHTDEKKVLFEKIREYVKKSNVGSLLDIGAGNGLLAIPLSKEVREYLAIEPKESFAEKLRAAELRVIEEMFPSDIDGSFDMVLSSHSISYDREKYEPFIRKAVELLNPDGIFLLITYRGQDDDWTGLMEELGEKSSDYARIRFNKIIEFLYQFGDVKKERVTTLIRTKTAGDMMRSLAFVASDGDPERKAEFLKHSPKLERILNSRYKDDGGYSFPFQHFFITTMKRRYR